MLVGCNVVEASGRSLHADSNVDTNKHNNPVFTTAGGSLHTLITPQCSRIIVISLITYWVQYNI